MLLTINNHSGVPVYKQIVLQISEIILSSQLSAGEQLMSVRDLASMVKVNPMTVSKAYSILERDGLLERKRGIGLFVRNVSSLQECDMRESMFEQAIEQAIKTCMRLGISEAEAIEKLKETYRKYGEKS